MLCLSLYCTAVGGIVWWGLHSTVALLTFLQLLLTLMADVLYAAYYKISGAWVWENDVQLRSLRLVCQVPCRTRTA